MEQTTENGASNAVLDPPAGGPPPSAMEQLFKLAPAGFPKTGDFVDGVVLGRKGAALYIDLGWSTGIVYGRELIQAKDMARNLRAGDRITAKIIELENEDGYAELSLKEAGQEIVWREAQELAEKRTPLLIKVKEANKGGLVLEWEGIQGFLPASQLRSVHYPRVEGGDKEKILEELKKLVGETLAVTIITANQAEEKLIFSEKEIQTDEVKEVLAKYAVGDTIEGDITGVVDFGVFIKLEEGLEGLAHISELSWSLVEDPRTMFKVGDRAKAKIIAIENGKISLSIKALEPDPWDKIKDKYKKGDIVEGVVIRINRYGVLVSAEEGVAGLVHISEFGSEKDMREKVELGKTYPFQITLFNPKEKKMTLAYLGEEKKG
ncbi:MAG: S1 RNA-binding domain-containing protein [Candidatus Niyogibacteria bacterium]|nr:S1 RNA-binding domain-containing protein [Candidatus Niyogibacteria bacterium]